MTTLKSWITTFISDYNFKITDHFLSEFSYSESGCLYRRWVISGYWSGCETGRVLGQQNDNMQLYYQVHRPSALAKAENSLAFTTSDLHHCWVDIGSKYLAYKDLCMMLCCNISIPVRHFWVCANFSPCLCRSVAPVTSNVDLYTMVTHFAKVCHEILFSHSSSLQIISFPLAPQNWPKITLQITEWESQITMDYITVNHSYFVTNFHGFWSFFF